MAKIIKKKKIIESFSWRMKINGREYGATFDISEGGFDPVDHWRVRDSIASVVGEIFSVATKQAIDSVCKIITGKTTTDDLLANAEKNK